MRGAGGTPGGLGTWGYSAFGLSLFPLLLGIGLLFFDGRSLFGWVLTAAGVLVILVGIIANLDVYFRPTSSFGTLVILTMLAAGIGLVARSLRAQGTD
jgi:hypothetical protein